MNDVMRALRDWLAAQAEVVALVGARVFVNQIPRETIEAEDTFHPNKMVVVRQAGGASKGDITPIDKPTISVLCYGESDLEADTVRRTIWKSLLDLDNVLQGDVRIRSVIPAGGPIPLVDPDIKWPAIAQNFSVMAAVF